MSEEETQICPHCHKGMKPIRRRSKGVRFICETETCDVIEVRVYKDGSKRVVAQPLNTPF